MASESISDYLDFAFVKDTLKNDPLEHRNAVSIGLIFFISWLMGLSLWILFIAMNIRSGNHLYIPVIFLPFLLLYFKKSGNKLISVNTYGLIIYVQFLLDALQWGQLYGDLNFWLLTLPMVAFLFANFYSGMVWFLVSIITEFYFYVNARHHPLDVKDSLFLMPEYYLVSSVYFAILIIGLSQIFNNSQSYLIQKLSSQVNSLNQTKERLKLANDQLETFIKRRNNELVLKNSKLSNIVSNLEIAVIETDIHGNILSYEDKLLNLPLFRSFNESLTNKNFFELLIEDEEIFEYLAGIKRGEDRVITTKLRNFGDQEFDVHSSPLNNGDVLVSYIHMLNKSTDEPEQQIKT